MVMTIYDPLGLVSPALVMGKILLRKLYAPGVTSGWDQDIPRGREGPVGKLVSGIAWFIRDCVPQEHEATRGCGVTPFSRLL